MSEKLPVKYFTLDQANRTLPLVRRIVTDIMEEYRQWKEHVFRYELVAAGSSADRGETAEQVALRQQVDQSAQRINDFMEELADIGCVFKGFEEGLVDFYSQLEGRDILLCWKLGEEAIEYWHEVDAGFAGRRDLAPNPSPSGRGEPSGEHLILRFLHYLGFALWMGGGWSTMSLVLRSRRDTPATRAGLFRILPAALNLMATGAVATVLSGIGLTLSLMKLGLSVRLRAPGVMVMQGSGILAAVILLAIALPTSRRIARLAATEPLPAEFERYRKRLAIASSVAGVLGLIALMGVTLIR